MPKTETRLPALLHQLLQALIDEAVMGGSVDSPKAQAAVADLADAWECRERARKALRLAHDWIQTAAREGNQDHPMHMVFGHARSELYEVLTGEPWLEGAGREETVARLREILGEEGE